MIFTAETNCLNMISNWDAFLEQAGRTKLQAASNPVQGAFDAKPQGT
jgi:hypothetical protein